MNEVLVDLNAIHKAYGSGDAQVKALIGVSLQVAKGELVAVMGSSGSGKSTLLAIAGGLERPDSGTVRVNNIELFSTPEKELARLRRQSIGYVFQDFNLIPSLTAIENVALPLELDGVTRKEARQAAATALQLMQILEIGKRFPDQVSGGQRQRIAIARSIVGTRSIILADEPTGALDSRTGEAVIRAIRERVDGGAAGVLVTHDAKNAAWADRILLIRDGLIVDEAKTKRDLNELIKHV
jgi:putative ABC transport system ATP-binding protein